MSKKPLKITRQDGSQIWFTGCTHIYHNKDFIWKKRGFNDVAHHAAEVQRIINEKVKPTDTLIHLGDGFLNCSDVEAMKWLSGVHCRTICYIWGNHESSMFRAYQQRLPDSGSQTEVYPFRRENVVFLGPYAEVLLDGHKHTVLSHFPQYIWNRSHHGSWNLHSHCHGSFAPSLPDAKQGKRLDVGWDVFGAPVSYDEVSKIMGNKEPEILDHHNSSTT